MIKIDIYKSGNIINNVKVNGHAEYADYGYDIVCSAISAITITIVNGLKDICKIDEIEIYSVDGVVEINIPDNLDARDREITNLFLETLVLGYKDIYDNYPDNISLKIHEVK